MSAVLEWADEVALRDNVSIAPRRHAFSRECLALPCDSYAGDIFDKCHNAGLYRFVFYSSQRIDDFHRRIAYSIFYLLVFVETFKKVRRGNVKDLGELEKAARGDPVRSNFVFLDLLKRQAKPVGNVRLGEVPQSADLFKLAAYMYVYGMGHSSIPLVVSNLVVRKLVHRFNWIDFTIFSKKMYSWRVINVVWMYYSYTR